MIMILVNTMKQTIKKLFRKNKDNDYGGFIQYYDVQIKVKDGNNSEVSYNKEEVSENRLS